MRAGEVNPKVIASDSPAAHSARRARPERTSPVPVGVTVCGGNDTVAAHITTVEWRGDGTAAPAAAELVRVGDTIELALGGGDETVTLTRIDAEIPSDLATVAHITSGTLELCDLAAPVEASVVDGSATRPSRWPRFSDRPAI